MKCYECGNKISDNARICPQCGAQFAPVNVAVDMSVNEYVSELFAFTFASVVVSISVGILIGIAMIFLGIVGGAGGV